ncbi:MAG TPA: hypothetical protein VF188_00485, partial [Longimicrobiales bacterium]
MALKGNAAFRYTQDGRETWLYLNAPLYDVRPARVRTRFTEESIDRRTLNVVVVDGGAEEITARLRFQGDPAALLDLLEAGADGETLEYFPDASLAESYPFRLMDASDIVAADPDPDRWWNAEYTVTLRLRRVDGGSVQALADNVLFRYVPGRTLAGATFTRASTATYRTRSGTLATAAADVPRLAWVFEPSTGLYRRALLVERDSTNLVPWSSALSNWTGSASITVQDDALVMGSLALALVTENDAAGEFLIRIDTSPFSGDGEKAFSCYVAQGTSALVGLKLRDTTASADRLNARISWAGGMPSVSVFTGTHLYTEPVGGGVYRLWFRSAPVLAANSHRVEVFPAASDPANTGNVYVGGVQVEDAPVPSSLIITAGAPASRAVESFTSAAGFGWQDLTVYVRLTETGGTLAAGENAVVTLQGGAHSVRMRTLGGGAGYSARLIVG